MLYHNDDEQDSYIGTYLTISGAIRQAEALGGQTLTWKRLANDRGRASERCRMGFVPRIWPVHRSDGIQNRRQSSWHPQDCPYIETKGVLVLGAAGTVL